MAQPKIFADQLDAGSGANQIVARDGLGDLDATTVAGAAPGSGANDLVQLDGSGNLPATDGSAITNVDAITLSGSSIGTGPNNIVQLNGSSQLPAVDGSLLTNLPAGGEVNTLSLKGAATGADITSAKVGVDLQVKGLIGGNYCSVNTGTNDLTVNVFNASTTTPGAIEIATQAEADFGTSGLAMTPQLMTNYAGKMGMRAVKTADQSVSSSTTLVNDSQLVITIPQGGWYTFELVLFHDGNTAGDLKVRMNNAAGVTSTFRASSFASDAAGGIITGAMKTSITSDFIIPCALTDYMSIVKGTIQVTGSGLFRLTWAQAVTNATATRVLTGSHLIVRRMNF